MNDTQQGTTNEAVFAVQPRFFVAPPLDERLQDIVSHPSNRKNAPEKRKYTMLRYAAYIRISSEEQVGNYSVDAQRRAIQTWVQARDGQLVKVYTDEAQTGKNADRPAFQKMRQDARKGKFDALVVHKFDRFARNRTDALAVKSLLRYDYGVKVFSVSEPSEDSDGPIGALIEGIMECVAEWYSRNLASEVSKGRREKSQQGFHNNQPPFGLKRDGKRLVPNPDEIDGLSLAFKTYSTGRFSYTDIAKLLNEAGYRSTTGRLFSKDTIREILRNEIYIGKIRYQETRHASDGKRTFTAPVQWFEGKHEAVIDEPLFEQCKGVRLHRAGHKQPASKYSPYLLRGLVYCYHCCSNPPPNTDFPSWGKLYCQSNNNHQYYRCGARPAGFSCPQLGVNTTIIDDQVLAVLSTLKPPADWRNRIIQTMSDILGEQNLQQRLSEIRATIERMDFRWDSGFITNKEEYLEKRLKLQQELEHLTPVQDELHIAADLLENFSEHLKACQDDVEKQHLLVKLIVERVYLDGNRVVALTLKSDYHLVLGHKANEPTTTEVDPFVHAWALRDSNP